MSVSQLAVLGGAPVREAPFPPYVNFGNEEKLAANRVLDSGVLSRFIGGHHADFLGGDEVRAFERAWADLAEARHGISVNSNTSGLYAAVGAAGVGPGDEVIVSPYSMSASATAALVFNAVPVFADIDPETYCMTAETISARITPRTKAVIVVHIFGQSCDMKPIMELAAQHDLTIIEDCAQAPLGTYNGRPIGAIGHMGVFSLNYHKHIHTGEGGMVLTNDDHLAERLQMIRNHAEAVAAGRGTEDLTNMIGFNFRLGEIEAAIGQEQLKKARGLIDQRLENVAYLESRLTGLSGLKMPLVSEGSSHVYYVHALDYDAGITGVARQTVIKALKAELPVTTRRESEGVLIGAGYVKPLYLLPIFQQKVGYGSVACPFACPHYPLVPDYRLGLCPNCEDAHFNRVITHELMRPGMSRADLDDVAAAFHKVWDNLDHLAKEMA